MELRRIYESINENYDVVLGRFGNNEQILERFVCLLKEDNTILKLRSAIADEECKGIELNAHAMKGVAANLNFGDLRDACDRLIKCAREEKTENIEELYKELEMHYSRIVNMIDS